MNGAGPDEARLFCAQPRCSSPSPAPPKGLIKTGPYLSLLANRRHLSARLQHRQGVRSCLIRSAWSDLTLDESCLCGELIGGRSPLK
jgi:hypothetical protein